MRRCRQHGLKAHLLGAPAQFLQRGFRVGHHGRVILRLGHLDQALGVRQVVLNPGDRRDGAFQLLAFAHQLLRGLRIVPQRRVFGLGVQFVQAAVGGIPVKDASSAGQWPARCLRRYVRFRGAWDGLVNRNR
jgi:hypothetical protein